MSERRYTEDEMAAIFAEATKVERTGTRQVARRDGMTLAELQSIGGEAGIPADLVAQAAHSLDRGERTETRHVLGLPIGVGRTVELERLLSDADWDRLVVDLRETFDARGKVRADGSLREWTNGNLHALLEPAEGGHRLRLRTTNANIRAQVVSGIFGTLLGGGLLTSILFSAGVADVGAIVAASVVTVTGVGMLVGGIVRLPRWARTRMQQMTDIANRLRSPDP